MQKWQPPFFIEEKRLPCINYALKHSEVDHCSKRKSNKESLRAMFEERANELWMGSFTQELWSHKQHISTKLVVNVDIMGAGKGPP